MQAARGRQNHNSDIMKFGWIVSVTMLMLCGCEGSPTVALSEEVPLDGWSREDELRFEWEIEDTDVAHDLMLDLRHAGNVGFSECHLSLTFQSPNGQDTTFHTKLILVDDNGAWIGNGFGDLVDCSFNLIELTENEKIPFFINSAGQFHSAGRHGLRIQHAMKDDVVQGLANVGVRLERR